MSKPAEPDAPMMTNVKFKAEFLLAVPITGRTLTVADVEAAQAALIKHLNARFTTDTGGEVVPLNVDVWR